MTKQLQNCKKKLKKMNPNNFLLIGFIISFIMATLAMMQDFNNDN